MQGLFFPTSRRGGSFNSPERPQSYGISPIRRKEAEERIVSGNFIRNIGARPNLADRYVRFFWNTLPSTPELRRSSGYGTQRGCVTRIGRGECRMDRRKPSSTPMVIDAKGTFSPNIMSSEHSFPAALRLASRKWPREMPQERQRRPPIRMH